MTENKAFVALIAVGLAVMSALWIALHSLGVSREGRIFMSIGCMIVTCFLVGFIPEYFPRDRHRR